MSNTNTQRKNEIELTKREIQIRSLPMKWGKRAESMIYKANQTAKEKMYALASDNAFSEYMGVAETLKCDICSTKETKPTV